MGAEVSEERNDGERFWGDVVPWTEADVAEHERVGGTICGSYVAPTTARYPADMRWCVTCGWAEEMHEIKRHVPAAGVA